MNTDRHRESQLRKLSRFLSMLLRHRPDRFPIKLDAEGYADLDEIMFVLRALPNFRWATYSDIDAVLEMPGRRRFEILNREAAGGGGARIRALYGHTAIRPAYDPIEPPNVLYHGTAPENLDAIWREGLQPMERQYVHLTAEPQTARTIALRHSREPIILEVDAARAHADGIVFYHPTSEIYLCDAVPKAYVTEKT
ncbi:MAG: RNA 2'-phosphotransferase [Anaerolineae bacterium]